jgi:hypothetical protein
VIFGGLGGNLYFLLKQYIPAKLALIAKKQYFKEAKADLCLNLGAGLGGVTLLVQRASVPHRGIPVWSTD